MLSRIKYLTFVPIVWSDLYIIIYFTLLNDYIHLMKMQLACKYFKYLDKINTTKCTILSAIRDTKFHLSITISYKISSFGDVIYFPDGRACHEKKKSQQNRLTLAIMAIET